MAFSYTVQAMEAISDLLNILGARPARNPPTPACWWIEAQLLQNVVFAWLSCILVLTTSAGWVIKLARQPAVMPHIKCRELSPG